MPEFNIIEGFYIFLEHRTVANYFGVPQKVSRVFKNRARIYRSIARIQTIKLIYNKMQTLVIS